MYIPLTPVLLANSHNFKHLTFVTRISSWVTLEIDALTMEIVSMYVLHLFPLHNCIYMRYFPLISGCLWMEWSQNETIHFQFEFFLFANHHHHLDTESYSESACHGMCHYLIFLFVVVSILFFFLFYLFFLWFLNTRCSADGMNELTYRTRMTLSMKWKKKTIKYSDVYSIYYICMYNCI